MSKIINVLILLLLSLNIIAKPISQSEAITTAQAFYKQSVPEYLNYQISYLNDYTIKTYPTETPKFLIVNWKNQIGYCIVSLDDKMYPVIAYSFSENFDIENLSPANAYLMEKYIEMYDVAIEMTTYDAEVVKAWDEINHNQKGQSSLVLPLLSTNWDQDCYYNLYTPSDMNGPCNHVYVGCVATSMAMVMKYHNYPSTGYGSHSYTHPTYGTLTANYANTTYSWTNMPNQLVSTSQLAQKQAVARLMSDCGIAVDMNYSANGSGSNTSFAADALSSYFRYNYSTTELAALNYTILEWGQILRAQIDMNQPVIYSGIDPTAGFGHAWVMDGYQGSNYFHMNWGWSGNNNGNFLLASLNVSGYSFSDDQTAVINIKPSGGSCGATPTFTSKTGKIEDGSGPSDYANNQNCSYKISPIAGGLVVLTFTEFNTESGADIVSVYDGTSAAGTLLGSFSGNSLPPILVASSGSMFITFTSNGSGVAGGWKASWSQNQPVYCTNLKFMTDVSSTFDDGSGINNYLSNVECKWLLKPTGASTVSLIFHEFNLHSSDRLYVYNGPNTSSALLGSYTGTSLPPNLHSTGNAMLLYFVTNGSDNSAGWKVSYFKDNLSATDLEPDHSKMKIFPNPADNLINIHLPAKTDIIEVRIFNAIGTEIYHQQATNKFSDVFSVDLAGFDSGLYLITVKADGQQLSKSFIKL